MMRQRSGGPLAAWSLRRCWAQMRGVMAERVDRDAGGEIEIALAVGGDQPGALAALETEIDPGEYREQMRRRAVGHGNHLQVRPVAMPATVQSHRQPARKTKRATFSGRHVEPFYAWRDNCQPVTL